VVSAAPAFLWWDARGGEGITGSVDAAWRVAARGLDAAGLAGLVVTVKEARAALSSALEVIWEPTGRAWTGRRGDGGDVDWESVELTPCTDPETLS
jgi:hypothetical protein